MRNQGPLSALYIIPLFNKATTAMWPDFSACSENSITKRLFLFPFCSPATRPIHTSLLPNAMAIVTYLTIRLIQLYLFLLDPMGCGSIHSDGMDRWLRLMVSILHRQFTISGWELAAAYRQSKSLCHLHVSYLHAFFRTALCWRIDFGFYVVSCGFWELAHQIRFPKLQRLSIDYPHYCFQFYSST